MKFKNRIVRLIAILLLIFVGLFLIRLGYGYITTPNDIAQRRPSISYDGRVFESAVASKKNYAGSIHVKNMDSGMASGSAAVDQKYEKIANVRSASKQFDDDEKKLREAITSHNGIIQFENSRGRGGNRIVHLAIGIPPMRFDEFYQAAQKVGEIQALELAKTDKTNEFMALKVQRASLESNRNALLELRKQSGKIEEFINLQNRILDVEQRLRALGVQLGDFDEVNAFCTVKFSLAEYTPYISNPIKLTQRVKVALTWAAFTYMGLIMFLLITSCCAFFLLLAVDKFNLLRKIWSRLEEQGPA